MDNLTPRVQRLVTRLSGREVPGRPPAPLDPAVTETAYRPTLRRWFELTAQGPAADRAEMHQLYQELLRLMDDFGEPRAAALRRQWAGEWWQETGACPFCGEPRPWHEPDKDKEVNP